MWMPVSLEAGEEVRGQVAKLRVCVRTCVCVCVYVLEVSVFLPPSVPSCHSRYVVTPPPRHVHGPPLRVLP